MKLKKHIKKQHYVKVSLSRKGYGLTDFTGVVLKAQGRFVLMLDINEIFYDGLVIFRKKDITNLRRNDQDRFFDKMLIREGLKQKMLDRAKSIVLESGNLREILSQIKLLSFPVIIEELYGKEDFFYLAPS